MDGLLLMVWVVRLAFLVLLYIFLARVVRSLLRDLRAAALEPGASLGRLIVIESPGGDPEAGRSFDLDAITTLGRDVNNAIVVEDPFASADHAVLTYRGRSWYVEDLGSTNGSRVNGVGVGELVLGAGDRIELGDTVIVVEVAGDVG